MKVVLDRIDPSTWGPRMRSSPFRGETGPHLANGEPCAQPCGCV